MALSLHLLRDDEVPGTAEDLEWDGAVARATCDVVNAYRALESLSPTTRPQPEQRIFEGVCIYLCATLDALDALGSATTSSRQHLHDVGRVVRPDS